MNLKAVSDMIAKMPNGPAKQKLQAKQAELTARIQEKQQIAANKIQDGKGANGLNDTFKFEPTGHIMIEAIDKNGDVLETLVDKENLVVKGADEIALRALAGDPTRILYKNRTILTGTSVQGEIDKSLLKGRSLVSAGRLMHAANLVWTEVDEEAFKTEYSFIPTYLHIKEIASTDPAKVKFEITATAAAGTAPLQSEMYSTQTNLFIGLGNGKDRKIGSNESVMAYSNPADFTFTNGQIQSSKVDATATLSGKITRVRAVIERSPAGGKIEVSVNGQLQETLVSYKSDGIDTIEYEFTGLNLEQVSTVQFKHKGATETSAPVMVIKEIHADVLTKEMNELFSEFKSFETDFTTPTSYNTKPDAPYTAQLPYAPILKDSVTVSYQGREFTEVAALSALTPDAFYVDHLSGIVTFQRALTGVYIGFKLEEAIRYEEKVVAANAKLTTSNYVGTQEVDKNVANRPIGYGDDAIDTFSLDFKRVKPETVEVKVAGAVVAHTLTTNAVTGIDEVKLEAAPAAGDAVTATYIYVATEPKNTPQLTYLPLEEISNIKSLKDQNGTDLVKVETDPLNAGEYQVTDAGIKLNTKAVNGDTLESFVIVFESPDFKGKPTNYNRAIIDKPKQENMYPWFELDKGKIQFVAEFPEESMLQNMTIREMILANGPRVDDEIEGFDSFDVKAFSIVRVPETIKNVNTGIRITWTITLLNETSAPFLGGNN